ADAWERDKGRALPLYLRGWALAQAGQKEEGRRLMDLAHWLPLGNEETRYKLAEALYDHDQRDASLRELDLIVPLGGFESAAPANALGWLADEAVTKKDHLKAAEYLERVLLYCARTHSQFVRKEGYLLTPFRIHLYRAQGLLAAGRPAEEIRREMADCSAVF